MTERERPTSGEVKRLNPYRDPRAKRPIEPLALFLFGIRYYAGMLEDGDDNWSHALGHIQGCCAEFQEAINKRVGDVIEARSRETIAKLEQEAQANAAIAARVRHIQSLELARGFPDAERIVATELAKAEQAPLQPPNAELVRSVQAMLTELAKRLGVE